MQRKLFMFGTGKRAKNYTQLLNQMSICIDGYIDNDEKKWGTYFCNREVFMPDKLIGLEISDIIIACALSEVTSQLEQMGLQEQIISIEQVINSYLKQKANLIQIEEDITSTKEKTIFIDNLDGKWGGAEDWSYIVSASLIERGYHVILVENTKQPSVSYVPEENILRVDTNKNDEYHVYLSLINTLLNKSPFVLFNIRNSSLLWAAVQIKWRYPGKVWIISSILNDYDYAYRRYCGWNEIVDLYLCISSRIQNNLVNKYKIDKKKVLCCTPFIEKIKYVNKHYHIKKQESLAIGYPCRLVRNQKRTDLLPELITYMNKKGIDYMLNIAGEGECEKELKEYIEKQNLQERVRFYGRLSRVELADFLEEQDVYLNFSEYEGTSLTMLEAMANGCVPVVTDVSGVSDFIEPGINGFIADVGDLESLAEHMAYLDKNREKLIEYGKRCIDIVQEKCRLNKYMDYVESIIKSL